MSVMMSEMNFLPILISFPLVFFSKDEGKSYKILFKYF